MVPLIGAIVLSTTILGWQLVCSYSFHDHWLPFLRAGPIYFKLIQKWARERSHHIDKSFGRIVHCSAKIKSVLMLGVNIADKKY